MVETLCLYPNPAEGHGWDHRKTFCTTMDSHRDSFLSSYTGSREFLSHNVDLTYNTIQQSRPSHFHLALFTSDGLLFWKKRRSYITMLHKCYTLVITAQSLMDLGEHSSSALQTCYDLICVKVLLLLLWWEVTVIRLVKTYCVIIIPAEMTSWLIKYDQRREVSLIQVLLQLTGDRTGSPRSPRARTQSKRGASVPSAH